VNNNIKFAIVVEVVKVCSINNESFRQESAEVVIFDNAKEALAAFEAAKEGAALIVISADMDQEVRKDLGVTRKLGVWPWYQGNSEGVTYWEGRAQWHHSEPMTWTMKKGHISSKSWRAGFVALMRAAW
jgi:hypothetical protein